MLTVLGFGVIFVSATAFTGAARSMDTGESAGAAGGAAGGGTAWQGCFLVGGLSNKNKKRAGAGLGRLWLFDSVWVVHGGCGIMVCCCVVWLSCLWLVVGLRQRVLLTLCLVWV